MMNRFLFGIISGSLLLSGSFGTASSSERQAGRTDGIPEGMRGVVFQQKSDQVEILIDGEPFTSYHFRGYQKPVFFPLRTASGVIVTRGYPMITDVPGEVHDHPHHKGLWFTHGSVNGVDFWSEGPRTGRILHREFLKMAKGEKIGFLESRNEWVSPEGSVILKENRVVKIQSEPGWRIMDLQFTLTAGKETVVFGDTKEGSFGIRLAQTFAEDSGGRIENSHGESGEAGCWGKRADWVDYTTTIAGQTVGVAIFNHPNSFRHPTYWHVRGYTLFAANPFGLHDFLKDPSQDGSYKLKPGDVMTLIYRVCIHPGTTRNAQISERYSEYVRGSK